MISKLLGLEVQGDQSEPKDFRELCRESLARVVPRTEVGN